MGLPIQACHACGHPAFPPRLSCSRCGSNEWRTEIATEGIVEAVTVVRRGPAVTDSSSPVRLGVVQADLGVRLIVRLDDGAAAGQRVVLSATGNALHGRLAQAGPR